MGSAITFEHVGFDYPASRRRTDAASPVVLGDVSFDVAPGSVFVLVGRSGAGKSTILKLINRMLAPTRGTVRVSGQDTRNWPELRLRRSIGYVLQDVGLFPHFTVAENAGLVPRLEGWTPDRIQARVRELLELVGLPPATFANRRPDELSGGQRQRVGVARALAADPPFLLMDEPFGALDPATRAELQQEFARIQSALAKTVVMVTHDMREAFALGSTIGVLDAGALIAQGTPAEIRASSDSRVRSLL
jgi:osmoprotectant transport system ATP-binding protein